MIPARRKSAFTLLELIAALALSVMLMVGLLAVITSVSSSLPPADAQDDDGDHTAQALIALVRHDLLHARSIMIEADHVKFQGLGALDVQTHSPTHRSAEIEYLIEQHDQLTALVRQQRDLEDLTVHNTRRQLLMTGVTGFTLADAGKVADQTITTPPGPVYRLIVTCSDSTRPLIDRLIVRGGAS